MIQTWLTRKFGLEVPIVGAPMGGRSGGALVGAVSGAGGLGMLGAAAYTTPEWIAEESAAAAAHGPFGIGLQTWSLDTDDSLLAAAIGAGPQVISLSFGNPKPYVERVKDAGITVMSQVNTLDDMLVAERAGVDVIVAQGGEAGGHTGRIGTLPLLQEILEATELPVLAAGGIGSGRGLAAVIAAGAEGALVGTALLATPETIGPEYARDRIIAAGSADTVYTSVFDTARNQPWPTRWGGRAITNDFTAKYHNRETDQAMLAQAYDPADPNLGVVYAGQAAGLVNESRAAADVVREIAAQAERLLQRFG